MCGVVGIIGKKNASSLVLEGLKKLEYRGYDSAGIASFYQKSIQVAKSEGKLVNLINKVNDLTKDDLYYDTSIALGHTRWATHGNINIKNAHPLTSENRVAVVHNGIIENYTSIKKTLESEGYVFTSQTDTEVLPHLFNKYLKKGHDFLQAGRLVLKDIRGAFVYRNLKTLFTSVVNLSIYSDFDENIIPAKKIINLLNSRGIARMMPSNTNDIYTYTPLYKLYPNPADELKRLYDSNYFGTPKK